MVKERPTPPQPSVSFEVNRSENSDMESQGRSLEMPPIPPAAVLLPAMPPVDGDKVLESWSPSEPSVMLPRKTGRSPSPRAGSRRSQAIPRWMSQSWRPWRSRPATAAPVPQPPDRLPPESRLSDPSPSSALEPAPSSTSTPEIAPVASSRFRHRPLRLSPALVAHMEAIARFLAWTALWLGVLSLSGGLGLLAYQRLTALPPVPDCSKLSPLAADGERLYCARETAQSGELADLTAAVDLVRDWPGDHPLNRDAKALLRDWSRALMKLANAEMANNNLLGAVDVASRIPANSPLYGEAQEAIAQWQHQWTEGESIYERAQQALQAQDWDLANEQLRALGELDNPYWRQQQVDALASQILMEQQAWQVLQQARQLAANQNPERLGQAIRLIQDLSPQSYAWRAGEVELNRWSQLLISYGMQQWEQGNLEAAIALVEPVPPDPNLAPEAYDFLQFSYAQRRARMDANFWKPTLRQIAGLMEAIAVAQRIRPESPFYDQAQSSLQTWQATVQNAMHLGMSNLVAGLGTQQSLETAIAHAAEIGADQPRRLQAQTLIAHWQQDIERLEDLPILQAATAQAASGTIPDLQAAIAQAQQIQLGRALRIEAQTAIAQWRGQIEAVEDQPLLDEAMQLARNGQLQEAIRAAGRINADRALYAEAQSRISAWQAELREQAIAADRPILDDAYSLAAKEWYSAAIDRASQIGSGSPLYGDAQAAIAQWRNDRDALLQQWGVSTPQASAPEPEEEEVNYQDYYSPNYRP